MNDAKADIHYEVSDDDSKRCELCVRKIPIGEHYAMIDVTTSVFVRAMEAMESADLAQKKLFATAKTLLPAIQSIPLWMVICTGCAKGVFRELRDLNPLEKIEKNAVFVSQRILAKDLFACRAGDPLPDAFMQLLARLKHYADTPRDPNTVTCVTVILREE